MKKLFSAPTGRKMQGERERRPAFAGKLHDSELSGARWQAIRATQLATFPICEFCGKRMAEEVHHIIPRAHGGDTFDSDNLASVCKNCHGKLPAMYKRGVLSASGLVELIHKRRLLDG